MANNNIYIADSDSDVESFYINAIEQIKKCIDIFNDQENEISKLEKRITSIETLLSGLESISDMSDRITWLHNLYGDLDLSNIDTLLKSIESNSKLIKTILKDYTNVTLPYDPSVLQSGSDNIKIDPHTNEKTIIHSYGGYEVSKNSTGDLNNYYTFELNAGKNFGVIYACLDDYDASDNSTICINIDDMGSDSESNWEKGQSFKFYFDISYTLESDSDEAIFNYDVLIYTATTKIAITAEEMRKGNTLELICLGDDKFIYLIN